MSEPLITEATVAEGFFRAQAAALHLVANRYAALIAGHDEANNALIAARALARGYGASEYQLLDALREGCRTSGPPLPARHRAM